MVKIGQKYISRLDELDSDEHDNDRITPAGSVWEVTHLADPVEKAWSIVCHETGGWINPNEEELARDFYRVGSFEYRVREYWPDVADDVLAIVRGTKKPWEFDDSIVEWREPHDIYPWYPSRRQRIADKMQAIDKLIEGFGCEAIFGDDPYWPDMGYSNQGDTYAPTIVFDYVDNVFRVCSWGDWIEDAERKGRTYA